MQHYANLGGDSNVLGFETGPDWIKVQFRSGSPYVYSYATAGSRNVEHMKSAAQAGRGLNKFINTHAKYKYVR